MGDSHIFTVGHFQLSQDAIQERNAFQVKNTPILGRTTVRTIQHIHRHWQSWV